MIKESNGDRVARRLCTNIKIRCVRFHVAAYASACTHTYVCKYLPVIFAKKFVTRRVRMSANPTSHRHRMRTSTNARDSIRIDSIKSRQKFLESRGQVSKIFLNYRFRHRSFDVTRCNRTDRRFLTIFDGEAKDPR